MTWCFPLSFPSVQLCSGENTHTHTQRDTNRRPNCDKTFPLFLTLWNMCINIVKGFTDVCNDRMSLTQTCLMKMHTDEDCVLIGLLRIWAVALGCFIYCILSIEASQYCFQPWAQRRMWTMWTGLFSRDTSCFHCIKYNWLLSIQSEHVRIYEKRHGYLWLFWNM